MLDIRVAWKYADCVEEPRRSSLAGAESYEALIQLAVEDVRSIHAHAEPGRDPGLTDCMQPVFDFELPDTGDRLFNGPFGYRAQYWIGPDHGLAANALLMQFLASKLLGAVNVSADPRLSSFDVCASIHATSAKFWIQEIPSWLAQPSEDLAVERWVEAARRGVNLAHWGICAMPVIKFQVKGALLDPYGNEVVPARKIRRHYDIHHYGYS